MTQPHEPDPENDAIKQHQQQSADQEYAFETWRAQVLSASGDPNKSQQWFDIETIACFGNRTARERVSVGRAQDVLTYIDSWNAGAAD